MRGVWLIWLSHNLIYDLIERPQLNLQKVYKCEASVWLEVAELQSSMKCVDRNIFPNNVMLNLFSSLKWTQSITLSCTQIVTMPNITVSELLLWLQFFFTGEPHSCEIWLNLSEGWLINMWPKLQDSCHSLHFNSLRSEAKKMTFISILGNQKNDYLDLSLPFKCLEEQVKQRKVKGSQRAAAVAWFFFGEKEHCLAWEINIWNGKPPLAHTVDSRNADLNFQHRLVASDSELFSPLCFLTVTPPQDENSLKPETEWQNLVYVFIPSVHIFSSKWSHSLLA